MTNCSVSPHADKNFAETVEQMQMFGEEVRHSGEANMALPDRALINLEPLLKRCCNA